MMIAMLAQAALAQCTFGAASYNAVSTMTDHSSPNTQMTMSFDGTYFYAPNGGSNPMPVEIYDAAGSYLSSPSVGMDFRASFSKFDGTNTTYFRGYASTQIRKRTPGGVSGIHATLAGGSVDAQAAVAWDNVGGSFVVNNYGVVNKWTDGGVFLGTTTLSGFDSHFSASWTNGLFWVLDVQGGTWKGYQVGP